MIFLNRGICNVSHWLRGWTPLFEKHMHAHFHIVEILSVPCMALHRISLCIRGRKRVTVKCQYANANYIIGAYRRQSTCTIDVVSKNRFFLCRDIFYL